MRRVGSRGDVVFLLLPLVLPDHETRGTRAGEEGDDGRAYGHDEILDECLHVLFHGKFSIEVQKSEGVSGLIIYT